MNDIADEVYNEVAAALDDAQVEPWVRARVMARLDLWIDDTIALRKSLRETDEARRELLAMVFRNVGGAR